jgi:hypothetical protein
MEGISTMRFTSRFLTAAAAVLVSLIVPGVASAQHGGVKGGFNANTIVFSPNLGSRDSAESLIGWTAGAWVAQPVHPRFEVQIEALAAHKGARELFRFDDSLKITYLEVPVLLRLRKFISSGGYLVAGPSVAFALSSTYESDGVREDASDGVRKVDVGLTVGAGVEVRRLVVDARYTWGVSRVVTDSDFPNVALRNRSFTVTAGFCWAR